MMTLQKPNKIPQPQRLLEGFSILFYVCKFMGIVPHDFKQFRQYKILQNSQEGQYYVICTMIMVFINFNLMMAIFDTPDFREEKDMLSTVIGLLLTYFSLAIYLADRTCALLNQTKFVQVFEDIHELDSEFLGLNIKFDNRRIQFRNVSVLIYTAVCETFIFAFTFALLIEQTSWTAWFWTFTAIPTFCNTLDKIWYVSIVISVRNRFAAINEAFNDMAMKLQNKKRTQKTKENSKSSDSADFVLNTGNWVEIEANKFKIKKNLKKLNNYFGDTVLNPQIFHIKMEENDCQSADDDDTSNTDELEQHLTKLCQLHDGLCQVMKSINDVWRFPLLILMGYGFFIITAQLYFFYCSNVDQVIPSIFRPARNTFITFVYLLYITSKCVSILVTNWQTDLEAKKSAICLHRCALAADNDGVYEMVNHLSLKLFNHVLGVSACGFFRLDMSTFYGFCGGITSYLIILIQFNIEEQQVKFNSNPVAAVPSSSLKSMPLRLSNETNSAAMKLFSRNSSALIQANAFDPWEFF